MNSDIKTPYWRKKQLRVKRLARVKRKETAKQHKFYFNDIQRLTPKFPHLKGKDDFKTIIKGNNAFKVKRGQVYKQIKNYNPFNLSH